MNDGQAKIYITVNVEVNYFIFVEFIKYIKDK